MKVKTLSAVAGVGSALILGTAAHANYVGLTVVKHTTVAINAVSRDVYRVYAMFSDPGDFLTAVAGSPTLGNMVIQSRNAADTGSGGNFVNPVGGSATAPTFYAVGTQLEWDTFVDIGLASVPYGGSDLTGLSPGFSGIGNISTLDTNNAGWFVTGEQPQGSAVNGVQNVGGSGNFGVIIMQLTVNAGNHVRGTVAIQGLNTTALAGLTNFQAQNQAFNSIPVPGALALVGLAGLVGAPRRRRGC